MFEFRTIKDYYDILSNEVNGQKGVLWITKVS